ncbi:MAG: HNH endonuclease [Candidatus Eisenbacteria bacterium]
MIFKLKQEQGGWIVGFGVFAAHVIQPMWLAWDEFDKQNGAATFTDFHQMLSDIRSKKGKASDPTGSYEIGCVLLSDPIFFPRDAWIPAPIDWKPQVVQEAGYDLTSGEGARIWDHCRQVAAGTRIGNQFMDRGALYSGPRHGKPTLVHPRMGQGIFRAAVTDAYGRACAVTTEHSLPVLEAAHIRPFAEGGDHELRNGVLLRTDIHRLFDRGYVSITPELEFVVSRKLKDEFANGKTYYSLQGRRIHSPRNKGEQPAAELLDWHLREKFRG